MEKRELLSGTGSRILDAILSEKDSVCQKNDIELHCVANGALLHFLGETDMTEIFGRALDQAIACEKQVPDREKRLVCLAVFSQKDFLLLRVEYYFEKAADTDPAWMAPIRTAACPNGGAACLAVRDHWVEIRLLLPMDGRS